MRFDEAWLTNLLAVFKTLNKVILQIREIDVPYTVTGPKWMKMSTLLNDLTKASASNEPLILLGILELLSTRKDLVRILEPSSYGALSMSEKMQMIDRYLNSNVYGKISLEEVASYLGMSRTYFCMFFSRHYGKGFSEYLNDLRIEKAVTLLSVPSKQIADIARECGFKTAPYFTRAFKKSKGMTPMEYRKKLK